MFCSALVLGDATLESGYLQHLGEQYNYRVIRYLNWMLGQQNQIVQERWVDRVRVDDARWSGTKGAPVEIMVDLANSNECTMARSISTYR